MHLHAETKEHIIRALDNLPPESLAVVAEFVEYLQEKAHQEKPGDMIVRLGGLWEGYSFSETDIDAARRETWEGLGKDLDA